MTLPPFEPAQFASGPNSRWDIPAPTNCQRLEPVAFSLLREKPPLSHLACKNPIDLVALVESPSWAERRAHLSNLHDLPQVQRAGGIIQPLRITSKIIIAQRKAPSSPIALQ